MQSADVLIRCDQVQVRRGDFVLGPIDLAMGAGITTIVGRNGAGKTTLLRTLVGLVRPDAGRVVVAQGGDERLFARHVGYVAQGAQVPGHAVVRDVVGYAAWLKGVARRSTTGSVADALTVMEVAHLEQRRVRTLSGGERQRVSIAMALVHDPSVLILDEPSVGLDPVQRLTLRRTLDRLSAGRAIVVSTHLVEDMGGDADRVLAMSHGKVVFTGSTDELRGLARIDDIGSSDLERGLWHVLGSGEP